MTLDLSPTEEAGLAAARQQGLAQAAFVKALVAELPAPAPLTEDP